MQVIRYRPGPPLDGSVACFWWSHREQAQVGAEHMLPSGSVQLIFALHEAPITCLPHSASAGPQIWSKAIVHGPQWRYYRSGCKPEGAVAGVSFLPGAAGAILGVPTADLTGRHVPIDDVWGARGHALRERLLAARGPAEVFRVLERDLTVRLARPLLMRPTVARALALHGNNWASPRIADLERDMGCSPRHFIALFRAAVGLTPKHYYRIRRFTAVLRRLAKGGDESLADLAASVGYADQSHLTREFREFAGVTPTRYRPPGPDSILHHQTNAPLPGTVR